MARPARRDSAAVPHLSSAIETRNLIRESGDLRRVRVIVAAANGLRGASEMASLLRARMLQAQWEVENIVRLEAAADVHTAVSAARRAVRLLSRKIAKPLSAMARGGRQGRARTRALEPARGVCFADGTAAASIKGYIDSLDDAETSIKRTTSAALRDQARHLAGHMRRTRLLLRRFASSFASLEARWGRSERRRSRTVWLQTFVSDVLRLDKDRSVALEVLDTQEDVLTAFSSGTIPIS